MRKTYAAMKGILESSSERSSKYKTSSKPYCKFNSAKSLNRKFHIQFSRCNPHIVCFCYDNGGAKRDRTADLLNAIQALSQLSYGPDRAEGGI
jgi:hypothetical protein